MDSLKIEVSIGEIVDKLSILEIKSKQISDPDKLKNVIKEHSYLTEIVFGGLKISQEDFQRILKINEELWEIEDLIRDKERSKEFDSAFIDLARRVYFTNDERSRVKKNINLKYGSNFVEEKSYQEY